MGGVKGTTWWWCLWGKLCRSSMEFLNYSYWTNPTEQEFFVPARTLRVVKLSTVSLQVVIFDSLQFQLANMAMGLDSNHFANHVAFQHSLSCDKRDCLQGLNSSLLDLVGAPHDHTGPGHSQSSLWCILPSGQYTWRCNHYSPQAYLHGYPYSDLVVQWMDLQTLLDPPFSQCGTPKACEYHCGKHITFLTLSVLQRGLLLGFVIVKHSSKSRSEYSSQCWISFIFFNLQPYYGRQCGSLQSW